MNWSDTPRLSERDWHHMHDGQRWKVRTDGVVIGSGNKVERTAGEPQTCRAIAQTFGRQIIDASLRFNIAPELILMTIATEAAAFRSSGFTGPATFRWESHALVNDSPPEYRGDYSTGPMQVLAGSGRWVIRRQGLELDPFVHFPAFREQPNRPPEQLSAYQPNINILTGAAIIAQRWKKTGDDPVLVSAAYNAGGVYQSNKNDWHIRCHGNHLDRAVRWLGDACAVISELRNSNHSPLENTALSTVNTQFNLVTNPASNSQRLIRMYVNQLDPHGPEHDGGVGNMSPSFELNCNVGYEVEIRGRGFDANENISIELSIATNGGHCRVVKLGESPDSSANYSATTSATAEGRFFAFFDFSLQS